MRNVNKWARRALSACSVAVAGLAAAPAQAEVIQLGFILDSSGSIGAGNWTTIAGGLATAIGLIPTSGPDSYEVSVVAFSTGAATIVDSVLITAANKAAVQATIAAAAFQDGNTNFAAAFTLMTSLLNGGGGLASSTAGQKTYVNFATDGVQNGGGTGVTEKNALLAAGIDNLSVEAIGSGVDSGDLQTNFCSPAPCDTTNPYNFPTQGFYIGVANAAEYVAAINLKIRVVTGQVSEPASLALVGLALGAAGFARRRRPLST